MPADLAKAVHNRLASLGDQEAYIGARGALMAVLEQCDRVRTETGQYPGWSHADELEGVIARALGIEV